MRIAISVSEKEMSKGNQSPYFQALVAAGARPEEIVLVSPGDSPGVRAREFDGVLFAGGSDVSPAFYEDRVRYPDSVQVDEKRDSFEFALLEQSLARKVPVLGICRGLQLINVHAHGTLYQHLPAEKPTDLDHQQSESRGEATHAVTLTEPDSRLAESFQGNCQVNSMHHQAVHRMGRGLKATAYSEDGFVEAIESADGSPLLAVQWHPEEMVDRPEQRKIFEQFLARCRERAAGRKLAAE